MVIAQDIQMSGGATMTKRLVEIDDGDLKRAQELLGAATIKETVERALKDVLAAEARRQHIELLRTGYLAPMADKEFRRRAWGQ
jgi:Arc/MetJ family transcription regulator